MTGSLGLVLLGWWLIHVDTTLYPIMTINRKEKKRKSEEPKPHRVRRGAPQRFRIASVNVGTMNGRANEIVEMLERRSVDIL